MTYEWQPVEDCPVQRNRYFKYSCLFLNERDNVEETELEYDSDTKMEKENIDEIMSDSHGEAWSKDSEN